MKKSKEFIIRRRRYWSSMVQLCYISGNSATTLCYRSFVRYFGINLKQGEKKRIKITIEECVNKGK